MSSRRNWQEKMEQRLPRLPVAQQAEVKRGLHYGEDSRSRHILKRRASLMAFEPVIAKFVKNGDKFFEGVKVNVSKRTVKSWDVLMAELSTRINLPAGVRNVYTPERGHKITNLSQLEHLGTYVCGSTEPFKRIDYSSLKHPDWRSPTRSRNQDNEVESIFAKKYSTTDLSTSMHSTPGKLFSSLSSSMSSEGHLPLRRKPSKLKPLKHSLTAPDEKLEANIINDKSPTMNIAPLEHTTITFTVFRNGPLPRERVTVTIKKNSSWDSIKQTIGRKFLSINGCLRLFTLSGTALTTADDLWEGGTILIAAGVEAFDISRFLSGEGEICLYMHLR